MKRAILILSIALIIFLFGFLAWWMTEPGPPFTVPISPGLGAR